MHSFRYSMVHITTIRKTKSPNQLQRELNLTRRRRCLVKCTRAANLASGHVEQGLIRERRREVGVIHNIEELRPKLHVEGLGDPFDVVVFEEREIEVDESRP